MDPGERVWSLGAAEMGIVGCGAEPLSSITCNIALASVCSDEVRKVKEIFVRKDEMEEWIRTCWWGVVTV